MIDYFRLLFDTTDFPARWYCGNWSVSHGWLHIISDLGIAGAYFTIPCLLAYFVIRRSDVPFPPIFWLFAMFIFSCGIGHAIEATLFWQPWYRFSGLAKFVTAVVSWATVFAMIPLIPKALALPGLAAVNQQLRREIVRREKAEEQRRQIEAKMQQAQKLESLGVLAGGIAHDFNNLLTSILGYADLARKELPQNSAVQPMLEQILFGAKRAAELTNQMLAYSGKGHFIVQPINLAELVESMQRFLRISISKKCAMSHHTTPNLPLIEADISQMRQVVLNLILNAAEAIGDREGTITISTGSRFFDREALAESYLDEHLPGGEYVYLEVIDDGCGMSQATLRRIFDPFYSTKFMGRGLGLAAVLGIVRGHHGAIQVESEEGKGTTFRILLPACSQSIASSSTVAVKAPVRSTRGQVLVIEDEEPIRLLVREMFTLLGWQTDLAVDGRDGVNRFCQNPDFYDLVLLDLTMPNLDGTEVLRELRTIRAEVPVILMSGYTEQVIQERFETGSLAGFLQKPFRFEDLSELIRQVVKRPRKT